MRRYLLSFIVLVWSCVGALGQQTGPIYCGQSALVNVGAATQKLVSDASGNAKTFVCGFDLTGGAAAATVVLQSGTGASTCAGNLRAMTGIMNIPINGPLLDSSPVFRGSVTDPGSGLCITGTGGPTTGVLYYTQQ